MKRERKQESDESKDDDISFEDEDEAASGEGDDAHKAAQRVKKLKGELAECKKQRDEYLAGWKRAQADYVNARNEEEKRRASAAGDVRREMVAELLPVLDSFAMAFSGDAWEKVDATWRTGVEYIHTQLMKTLEENGLTVLDPAGEPFDPAFHESIETVPAERAEDDDVVAEVVQKGYAVGERVVRPARVKVYAFNTENK